MALPVRPPVAPMLAKLVRDLPAGEYTFEPKWDGFRCLAFRDGDDVDLRSRNDRPLARYFPELTAALRGLEPQRFVLDGEIVVITERGFEFPVLMSRLHPAASRALRLSEEAPAQLVAFDLLALDGESLCERPFAERRDRLAALLANAPEPLALTPSTTSPQVARDWLARFQGAGIDGVVAKPAELPYQPGKRAMLKVKPERTADCVVAGFRTYADAPLVAALLLGLYDGAGRLEHVGVASSFTDRRRAELLAQLRPLAAPLAGHPWERGFLLGGGALGRLGGSAARWSPDMELDWTPLAPLRVCEVAYDHVDVGRFRHPARFRRWRPDRDPESCGFDQLEVPAPDPHEVLAG